MFVAARCFNHDTSLCLTHLQQFSLYRVIMLHIGVVALLLVSCGLTNGQETGVGLGTCTYSFVVQSPYCGKDVGADAEADIQRLQVSDRSTLIFSAGHYSNLLTYDPPWTALQ